MSFRMSNHPASNAMTNTYERIKVKRNVVLAKDKENLEQQLINSIYCIDLILHAGYKLSEGIM